MFSLEVLYIPALVPLHTILSPIFKTFVIRARQCESHDFSPLVTQYIVLVEIFVTSFSEITWKIHKLLFLGSFKRGPPSSIWDSNSHLFNIYI